MNKIIILVGIIMITFSACTENSGLKAGLDLKIIKVLEKLDLNNLVKNKTLINQDGLDFQKKNFPSYKLHVSSLSIMDLKNPSLVDLYPIKEGDTQFLNLVLKNLEVEFQTDFDLRVISLFSDRGTKTSINVVLDQLDTKFYIKDGHVYFTNFNFKLGKIDLHFSSVFFKVIYFIAKSLIIEKINEGLSSLNKSIEVALNNFINTQQLIDIGLGIGFNSTIVDKPEYELYNHTKNKQFDILKLEKKFLGENLKTNNDQRVILKFGVHGSLYPNLAPEFTFNFPPASQMKYLNSTFENKITLLISDYTVNSILFMGQQTGALKYQFTNETNTILPFNVDTQGVSSLIPELAQKYNETKLMQIKLYVNPLSNSQPLAVTDLDGFKLTFNFGIDFNVFTSPDPWEDPVMELQLNVTTHAKIQFMIVNSKVSLVCFRAVIDEIIIKVDGLKTDPANLQKNLDGLINDMLKKFKPMMTNIDVLSYAKKYFNHDFSNPILNTDDGFLILSTDIDI